MAVSGIVHVLLLCSRGNKLQNCKRNVEISGNFIDDHIDRLPQKVKIVYLEGYFFMPQPLAGEQQFVENCQD